MPKGNSTRQNLYTTKTIDNHFYCAASLLGRVFPSRSRGRNARLRMCRYGRFRSRLRAFGRETNMKVAIVGAGIAGLSLAWALHKRGVAVSLFDQGAIPNPV